MFERGPGAAPYSLRYEYDEGAARALKSPAEACRPVPALSAADRLLVSPPPPLRKKSSIDFHLSFFLSIFYRPSLSGNRFDINKI